MRCRRYVLLLMGMALVSLASCTRTPPGVQHEEMRILANWIEDSVHGIPRRPGELELFGASAEFTLAAQWAMGNAIRERRIPPQQIQARITRAPALKAALRSHVVHIEARQGMVGPAPQLTGADFVLAAQIADNENRDRRTIDAVVLSRSEASSEAAAWYREAAREARVAQDLAAGGTEWPAKAP